MAHNVRLSDRDIDALARNVLEGRYREYVRIMLQIAIRERGSTISISLLEGNLNDLPYLNRSVVRRIVDDLEELYQEQQPKRAA